jgi:hypothetical protein
MLNFDLLNRDSYEDIYNRWKNFIINKLEYTKRIYLLGNYTKKGHHLTDRQEIDDLINDENIRIDYHEIGNFSNEELVKFFDDIIFKAMQDKINDKPSKDNNSGSCIIF